MDKTFRKICRDGCSSLLEINVRGRTIHFPDRTIHLSASKILNFRELPTRGIYKRIYVKCFKEDAMNWGGVYHNRLNSRLPIGYRASVYVEV